MMMKMNKRLGVLTLGALAAGAGVYAWSGMNTAKATFDVQNYESYVAVQKESSLRASASKHPYDSAQPGQTAWIRIPRAASCAATERTKPTTACFVRP